MFCSILRIQERNGNCWVLKHFRASVPCIWEPSGKVEVDQSNDHRNWALSAFRQGGFCDWLPSSGDVLWVVIGNSHCWYSSQELLFWLSNWIQVCNVLFVPLHLFLTVILLAWEDGPFFKHPVWFQQEMILQVFLFSWFCLAQIPGSRSTTVPKHSLLYMDGVGSRAGIALFKQIKQEQGSVSCAKNCNNSCSYKFSC